MYFLLKPTRLECFLYFQFPAGSQQSPSTEEVSPLVEYTEDSIIEQPETHTELPETDRKWNNFVVNLNGGIKKATVFPDKDVVTSPLPYQVAPSFEKRWPQNGMNGVAPQVNLLKDFYGIL